MTLLLVNLGALFLYGTALLLLLLPAWIGCKLLIVLDIEHERGRVPCAQQEVVLCDRGRVLERALTAVAVGATFCLAAEAEVVVRRLGGVVADMHCVRAPQLLVARQSPGCETSVAELKLTVHAYQVQVPAWQYRRSLVSLQHPAGLVIGILTGVTALDPDGRHVVI